MLSVISKVFIGMFFFVSLVRKEGFILFDESDYIMCDVVYNFELVIDKIVVKMIKFIILVVNGMLI